MAVRVPLGDGLELASYDAGWQLQRVHESSKTTKGYAKPIGYYARLEEAFEAALDLRLRSSSATTLDELAAALRRLRADLVEPVRASFQPPDLDP